MAALPSVLGVTPNSGSVLGGNTVLISVEYLLSSYSFVVKFGSVAATSAVFNAATQTITAIVPAGSLGPVSISVTDYLGTGTLASAYTYVPATTLFGNVWYDSSGNPLANGYLLVRLNQDATDGTNQYCAGRVLNLPLDAFGTLGTATLPNASSLFPSGTVYIVTAYSAVGELTWGPAYLTS